MDNYNGKWQYKTEKEYLCVRDGEERGFTAKEFKAAQAEGWEKQYRYKVGRKKVYMAPSEAEANWLTRLSKHSKSSKYGRQNPISERWNSEEQLVRWREAWADATNRFLERAGADTLDILRPDLARYEELTAQIKNASKERKALLDEKKAASPVRVIHHHELARGIAKLTEDLEELKTERTMLLSQYVSTNGTLGTDVKAVRNRISFLEATLQKVERRECKYTAELKAALAQYRELQEQAKGVDADVLDAVRKSIRSDMEREADTSAREIYRKRYDSGLMEQSHKEVAAMLGGRRAAGVCPATNPGKSR